MQIIQDYKDWKKTKTLTEIARQSLNAQLLALLSERQKNNKSSNCHMYPCACDTYILSCNESLDVYESFCRNCNAFKKLLKYKDLEVKMLQAQERQKQAKQKLLDNFCFWKHR